MSLCQGRKAHTRGVHVDNEYTEDGGKRQDTEGNGQQLSVR